MTQPITDAPADSTPLPTALAPAEGAPPSAGATDPYLEMIAHAARDPNVDLPKLQGLMAMKERIEDRRAKQAFYAALALAKGEFGPILKKRLVDYPHKDDRGRTSYKHEDLADIGQVVDPVLSKYGLSYRHRSTQEQGKVRVTCILSHADGYSEENSIEGFEDKSGQKNANQAVGSTITYLQRYTLKEALGIAAARDDDGRGGGDTDAELIDGDQLVQIQQLLEETESNVGVFFLTLRCVGFSDMTVAQWKRGMGLLEEKKRRLANKATAP